MSPFIKGYLWMSLCSLSSDMSLNTVIIGERDRKHFGSLRAYR